MKASAYANSEKWRRHEDTKMKRDWGMMKGWDKAVQKQEICLVCRSVAQNVFGSFLYSATI